MPLGLSYCLGCEDVGCVLMALVEMERGRCIVDIVIYDRTEHKKYVIKIKIVIRHGCDGTKCTSIC